MTSKKVFNKVRGERKSASDIVINLSQRLPDDEVVTPHEVVRLTGLAMSTVREAISLSGLSIMVEIKKPKLKFLRCLCNKNTARRHLKRHA